MTIRYISFDGEEFGTKSECIAHEKRLKKLLLSVKFYNGRTRMEYTTTEEFYDCYNTATRCVFPSLEVKREVSSYYGFCAVDKRGIYENHEDKCLKYRANSKMSSWQQDE